MVKCRLCIVYLEVECTEILLILYILNLKIKNSNGQIKDKLLVIWAQ